MLIMGAALLLATAGVGTAQAEGTRTLHPATGTGSTGNRGVMDATTTATAAAGVAYQRQFTYVYARAGEVILLGQRNRNNGGDIFVYDPNPAGFGGKGMETVPTTASFTCSTANQGTGSGYISGRAAELAGPNSADGTNTVPNGFTPCWYVAPVTGVYGVRFTVATSGNQANTALIATPVVSTSVVSAWDVTVRAGVSSLDDLNGRVFTYAWAVYLNANGRYLRNNLHYVSSDGYRYRQTFQGLDPNRAVFYANPKGFIDGGAPLYKDIRGSNQNVNGGTSFNAGVTAERPTYPIFFSDVDPQGPNATEVNRVLTALAIPQAPLEPQLTAPTFVGNMGGHSSTVSSGGVFTFTTLNTLTYEIVVRRGAVAAGADPNHPAGCVDDHDPANVCNRSMTGVALSGDHSVLWDGLDNSGHPFPVGDYDFQIVGRNGEIHFPIIDLEGNVDGGPTLTKLNAFNAAEATTVYFDDRGYRTANNTLVGELNGHLCGAGNAQVQPSPNHSLVGVDSADPNWNGSGKYYRSFSGSSDNNQDCRNNASEYFGTAKGLDLWALERSPLFVEPVEIVPSVTGVDVGTMATMTPAVLPGDTSYGSFAFSNAGDTTATGVTYSVTLGNSAIPATCPSAVTFTVQPAGATAAYNPGTCTISLAGMPTTLAPGQSLGFNFNYVVAPTNPGPIPLNTAITAANETNPPNTAPNTANAQTVVAKPVITLNKTSNPAGGSEVNVGDTITYTVTVNIGNAPLTSVFTLTDTLGAGLTFGAITNQSPQFTCSGSLSCTLPLGTGIGSYTVEYTATVNASASGSVANNVTGSGGGGDNPPSCSGSCTVTHNLPVSDMSPVFGGLPPVLAPGQVVTGATLTCTNAGPGAAAAATCAPSVDAGAISSLVCAPTPPTAVAMGDSIVCTFDYTAPGTPGGSDTGATDVTFTGTTGASNDTNPANNETEVTAPIIDALDDDFSGTPINGGTGGTTPSVIGNDTVGTDPVVIGGNASLTPGVPSHPGLVMNPDGTITVPPLLPPGTHAYPYTICVLPATAPPTCETATATIVVSDATVIATDDVSSTTPGTPKAIDVPQNDSATGGVIDPDSVVPTSDPSHGTVSCSAGVCTYTPEAGFTGTDSFTYKVCLAAPNELVCDEAVVTITVAPAAAVAPIPTLDGKMLVLMGMLLAGLALRNRRARRGG